MAFQPRAQTGEAPDAITTNPDASRSVYDPAIVETTPFVGTEYALSAFDTTLGASMFWQHNDHEQNVKVGTVASAVFAPVFQENNATWQAQLSKTNAYGGTWTLQNNTFYDQTNNPTWAVPSTYNANFQAQFSQPLLQGAGVIDKQSPLLAALFMYPEQSARKGDYKDVEFKELEEASLAEDRRKFFNDLVAPLGRAVVFPQDREPPILSL